MRLVQPVLPEAGAGAKLARPSGRTVHGKLASVSREVLEVVQRVLAARDDLELGVLFGSMARGTATTNSDVDLAILGRDADLLGISADLARALDREVQVVRLEDASIPLLESLIDDGRM